MATKNNKSKFVPEAVQIWLGQRKAVKQYDVYPASWASLFKLQAIFRELLGEITELWNTEIVSSVKSVSEASDNEAATIMRNLAVNPRLWEIVNSMLQKPQVFFNLAIPDLDQELFDENNPDGITIPQVWATFEAIAEVNQLEVAKNVAMGVLPGTKTK
jgi:hypothetical protein